MVVEAVQLTAENVAELAGWCGGYHMVERDVFGKITDVWVDIKTLEGTMSARLGWWIIKGVKGEFYPCEPEIFAETYEPANDQINYDGPDLIECAYSPCTNRLRRVGPPSMSGAPHPQWCSKEHRELTKGHETCWSDWTAVVVDDYAVELTYPCGMVVRIPNQRGVRVWTEQAALAHAQGLRGNE